MSTGSAGGFFLKKNDFSQSMRLLRREEMMKGKDGKVNNKWQA